MAGNNMYRIECTELSKDDYDKLDESQKVIVNKAINRIKLLGMSSGQPLSGALHHCRKLKHKKYVLCIVFRESPNGVEIIAIRKKR